MSSLSAAAARAAKILRSVCPNAACIPQEWDDRVDCTFQLNDGTVVGEMIAASEITDERIRATAERLRARVGGADVKLVDELGQPVRLKPGSDH